MNTLLPSFLKYTCKAGITFIVCLFTFQTVSAQASDYEKLAYRNNQPNVFVNVITLPGATDNSINITPVFRLSYNFLPFKKLNNPTKEATFTSTASLNIEVFQSPEKDLEPNKQVDIKKLQSVGRTVWQDTAYAANYDQTKSKSQSLTGSMQVNVPPGDYTYLLQLNINEGTKGRNSRTRNIHLLPYDKQQDGNIILVDNIDDMDNPSKADLINLGDNVPYAKDFYALIHLTDYDAQASYSMEINRVKPPEKEDEKPEKLEQVIEQPLDAKYIHTGIKPTLKNNAQHVSLDLTKNAEHGYTYALVKIPNKSFPNAVYQIKINANGKQRPVAKRLFQSYWSDIPTGLLSLDVAIDLLKFITDKETIKKIDDGSDEQREQKFRAFWKEKDPTPDTEFNELETEYYNRIDYAYEEFSSDRTLGFNTDQGNVYISYGKPNDIERTFPTKGATTETWTYDDNIFVFKATSGFGDFKLVSKK